MDDLGHSRSLTILALIACCYFDTIPMCGRWNKLADRLLWHTI